MSPRRYFREGRRLQGAVILALALLGSALGYYIYNAREAAARNSTAVLALCFLRRDIDDRIAASQAFLKDHPHGIPGIPASLIRQGLDNSKRTRKALRILDCTKGERP